MKSHHDSEECPSARGLGCDGDVAGVAARGLSFDRIHGLARSGTARGLATGSRGIACKSWSDLDLQLSLI
jgi:hypothetical protein